MPVPISPGFATEIYSGLRQLMEGTPIEGAPPANISMNYDFRAKRVTFTADLPFSLEYNPDLKGDLVKIVDFVQ